MNAPDYVSLSLAGRACAMLSLLFSLSLLSGCLTPGVGPQMTPLEIQSLQTREYEEDKAVVFPSVISVFQDLGYSILNADINTGLITAESAAQRDASHIFWTGSSRVTQTRATAFVEQIRGTSRVRLNFVVIEQTSTSSGQTERNDTPVLDATTYQNAFERIEDAIFIRSGT